MPLSFSNTLSLTASNFWRMPHTSQSSFRDSLWIQPTLRQLISWTICPLLVSSCALSLLRFSLKFFFSGFVPVAGQTGPSCVAPTVATGEDDEEEDDEEDDEEDEGEVEIVDQRVIAPSPPFSWIATRSQGSLQQRMEVVIPTHTPCIHLIGPESPPPSTPKRHASSRRGRWEGSQLALLHLLPLVHHKGPSCLLFMTWCRTLMPNGSRLSQTTCKISHL